jgi:hypothetical protein
MERLSIIILVLTLLFQTSITAQTLELSGVGLENVVNYYYRDSVGNGDLVVVSTNDDGILILDVSNALEPELVSSINGHSRYYKILLHDQYLYTDHGVFDLSNPAAPDSVGSFSVTSSSAIVEDSLGINYLAKITSPGALISFYSFTPNPADPSFVTSFQTGDSLCDHAIATTNRIVYRGRVSGNPGQTYARIVDASDILNLQLFQLRIFTSVYNPLSDMMIYENALYLIITSDAHIVNLDDDVYQGDTEERPIEIIYDLMVVNRSIFTDFYSLDNPFSPAYVGSLYYESDFIFGHPSQEGLAYTGYYGSLNHGNSGWMDILNLADPSDPILTPSGIVISDLESVVAVNEFAWTYTDSDGIWLSDFSQGTDPDELHMLTETAIVDIELNGSYMYVTQDYHNDYEEGLFTIDISDPHFPSIVDYDPALVSGGNLSPSGKITYNEHYLFYSAVNYYRIYDINIPHNPQLILQGGAIFDSREAFAFDGNILYTGDNSDDVLRAYDVSDPTNIIMIDELNIQVRRTNRQFAVEQGRAAVVHDYGNDGDIILIDASDPSNMIVAYEFAEFNEDNWTMSFDLEGELFFLGFENDLLMYDVSNVYNPVLLASAPIPGWAHSVSASEGNLYALIDDDLYHYVYNTGATGVQLQLVSETSEVPAEGGSVFYSAIIDNLFPDPATGQGWVIVTTPDGNDFETYRNVLTVPPGESTFSNLTQTVPSFAPQGLYTLTANLGIYPNTIVSSDEFDFIKTGEATVGSQHWNHSDWQPEIAGAGAAHLELLPTQIALSEALPNPFNPSTTITLTLPEAANVKAVIYNINGRQVTTLVNDRLVEGIHELNWTPSNLASGLYFVQASVNGEMLPAKKMVYLR